MREQAKMSELTKMSTEDIPHEFKLEALFKMQKTFGEKFVNFDHLTVEEKQKWTKEFVVCCMDELSEILNWTNWKHWKAPVEITDKTIEEIKFEIIDLLHFLLSLMLIWDMDANEVMKIYMAKNEENFKRQERGY